MAIPLRCFVENHPSASAGRFTARRPIKLGGPYEQGEWVNRVQARRVYGQPTEWSAEGVSAWTGVHAVARAGRVEMRCRTLCGAWWCGGIEASGRRES